MVQTKIANFFKDRENYLLFLASFFLAITTLFFVSREISWLGGLPYIQVENIYISYFLIFVFYLGIFFYILRNPVDWTKLTIKMILNVLPSALIMAWGLSISIHFNQLFRTVDYLFFIFIFFFLIYQYKGYTRISSFLKDIFFLSPGKKNQEHRKYFSWIIIISVIVFNLLFGMTYLTKHAAVDEPLWTQGRITKYWNNIQDGEYTKTMISDKPGITVALISGIGLIWVNPFEYKDLDMETTAIENYKNIEDMYWAMRLPIFLFITLMLLVFYAFIRYLLGEKIALLSVIFIGLSPLLIGISTIINPDSLLWTFAPLSLIGYLCYLKGRENKFLYASGIFLGLAILTKYIANIFYVFFPLLIFTEYLLNKEHYKEKSLKQYLTGSFMDYLVLVSFSLATIFLFLPAAWVYPSVIFNITLLSKAFLKVWTIFLAIMAFIALDIYFLKSQIISACLSFLSSFRSFIVKMLFFIFFFFIIAVFLDVYTGMKIYNLESILASPKSSYAVNNMLGLMMANFYSVIFGIIPAALFSMLFLLIFYLAKKEAPDNNARSAFYLVFFILTYYGASIANDVSATVRYQIIIYPLAFIISAIGLYEFSTLKFAKKYISYSYIYIILIILSVYSLNFIKPFYFSYANSLLPEQYVLNVKDMGDGSYEAAQYLNSLPDAKSLTVWTDKRGLCNFFIGHCYSGIGFTNGQAHFDYFVVSSGREKRTTTMTLGRYNGGNNEIVRLDKLYQDNIPQYKIEIGGRPNNYVKVINASFLE